MLDKKFAYNRIKVLYPRGKRYMIFTEKTIVFSKYMKSELITLTNPVLPKSNILVFYRGIKT